jgi:hypothetical protein
MFYAWLVFLIVWECGGEVEGWGWVKEMMKKTLSHFS